MHTLTFRGILVHKLVGVSITSCSRDLSRIVGADVPAWAPLESEFGREARKARTWTVCWRLMLEREGRSSDLVTVAMCRFVLLEGD